MLAWKTTVVAAVALIAGAGAALAGFSFQSIDGGQIDLDTWRGKPVLVVNTASLCGYAGQYDALQMLHERYGARGLLVLAVPSNDFAQELDNEAAVKEYCAVNFDLTLPMTEITHVKDGQVHPFYAWMSATNGFSPNWNFNKVLLGPDGAVIDTWRAGTAPDSAAIVDQIEALLP